MIVNLEWDGAALGAPQSFKNSIINAANILSATFVDPITLNISVGYGDLTENGTVIGTPTSALGLGGPAGGDLYDYSSLRNYLIQTADQTVTGALDLTPSTALNGHNALFAYSAEEKALGLVSGADTALDGAIGFATNVNANALVGIALHELTHAMGRISSSQSTTPDLFDLDRFTAQGLYVTGASPASSAYFSLDGGKTSLAGYNQSSSTADFLGNTTQTAHDAFDSSYDGSTLNSFTGLDIEQMQALGFHAAMSVPGQGAAFLGSGQVGIAFRDTLTGDWGVMSPTAGGEVWRQVGPTSTDYQPIAFGDFNGDGVTDTAYRQTTTGDWGFMTANAGSGQTWHPVGASSTAYAAIAVADFNGDGRADVMFRNVSTGDMGFMSANPGGGETWHAVGPTSIDYQVVGAADFNNDGVLDVAFRDAATNAWGYMTVNPGGGETWHGVVMTSLVIDFSPPGTPGFLFSGYQIIGVGDFNGDGTPDVAARDPASGDLYYGKVSSSLQSGVRWGPTSTAYVPVALADFNGDGHTDIAFRNVNTGDLGYMSLNSGGGETWHPMGITTTDYFAL